jgi:hypothetical protein
LVVHTALPAADYLSFFRACMLPLGSRLLQLLLPTLLQNWMH